jgi:hypothetical protein
VPAEQKVLNRMANKEPERDCVDDVSMASEGHITYVNVEAFDATEGLPSAMCCRSYCTTYTLR